MSELEILTDADSDRTVSRRTFIKGVIAAGATASSAAYLFRASGGVTAAPSAQSAMGRMVTLNVNGQQRRVELHPNETLALTLRYKLGLTGPKLGCDRAECGACTVLLDGVNHYSCSTFTFQVRDREITTVEGLEAEDGTPHPIQQAVLDEAGFQCAFCAPGFIMSMASLLEENPNPTREEAAQALAGNICRCGDYDKILSSAMRAAEYVQRSS